MCICVGGVGGVLGLFWLVRRLLCGVEGMRVCVVYCGIGGVEECRRVRVRGGWGVFVWLRERVGVGVWEGVCGWVCV